MVMSDVHFAYVSFSPFWRTKSFFSGIVTHIFAGNLFKNVRKFYLKFIGGGFNRTLSIHVTDSQMKIFMFCLFFVAGLPNNFESKWFSSFVCNGGTSDVWTNLFQDLLRKHQPARVAIYLQVNYSQNLNYGHSNIIL